jgi:DNA-directed RNA polymerase sigma subunit (sigma70/sigma32)
MGNGRPMSLREVGEAVGVSAETVRKVEREALRKLREAEVLQEIW